ncbi:MAG TPA: hypothetical protein DEP87_03140 [Candidatus Pacebacteria bacterium]|nr:hypothetical protein [Candidatus Paceibacterota bacterium]
MSHTRQIIQATYDRVAPIYNQDRFNLKTDNYLRQFWRLLPPQSLVLDLGCGDGLSAAVPLVEQGHQVIGWDFSATQLQLAKKNCSTGQFFQRDIATIKPHELSVAGAACLFTLFHISRTQHGQWLKTLASFLPVGGPLLITLGDCEFEGWHAFYGQKIWSSQFGPEKNRLLLEAAGFEILIDELSTSGAERHQIVLATKLPTV